MLLERPILLILLVPILALAFYRPLADRVSQWLRVCLYIVLVLGLAGLSVRLPSKEGLCVSLVDRSPSMQRDAREGAISSLYSLEKARPPASSSYILSFAESIQWEKLPGSSTFQGLNAWINQPDGSNVSLAIRTALGVIPEKTPARILLLGDGQWTGEDPRAAFEQAALRGIPVDYRFWRMNGASDVSVVSLSAPTGLRAGETFVLQAVVRSPQRVSARLRLRRSGGAWLEKEVQLLRGLNRFSWQDSLAKAGTVRYELHVEPQGLEDSVPGNNLARLLVTAEGPRRILLLSESPSGNLARLLRNTNMDVDSIAPTPAFFQPEVLHSYSCVILENVPASHLGQTGMELLAEQVRTGKLGLVMTGGKSAFANGGYYRSPLEDLLPLSMVQRREERRARSAIVIALDRSGSMGAPVSAQLTKMDLANQGTAEVARLLQPHDEICVLAVDTEPHEVLPLAPVKDQPGAEAKILSIEVGGGGIFIYKALREASDRLLASTANIRHIVLFADASDSEQPGDYQELLQELTKAGVTVSVIGLGSENDSDAPLLLDIAARANGTCYFSEDASELPRLFAEDTFQVALKAFIEDPATATFTQAAETIAPGLASAQVGVGGYNFCYPRDKAENVLFSQDENQAPLCAFWNIGLGRVAALAVEADGQYTGAFATSPYAPGFLAGLVRWCTTGEDASQEYAVTSELRGNLLHLEMELDPERTRDPFEGRPVAQASSWDETRHAHQEYTTDFQWTTPDRLEADLPLAANHILLPQVLLGNGKLRSLPPVTLPYSPEFLVDDSMPERLEQYARLTG
ncbi:MAG: VWA domain-containing protein, partial [Victivallales bacterium]|nr:VWA domain-containing protein [Victivallales bacterium]